MNQNLFFYTLGQQTLADIPELHVRLHADPPARIADLGCSFGWSSMGMAQAYPKVRIDGFDADEAAIETAWVNARAHGLIDRLTFHVRHAADPVLNGRYDLVTTFTCMRKLDNPVGVLRTMRRLAGETGTVLVMDEQSADRATVEENATLQQFAQTAGFQQVVVLSIDYGFSLYRLC